MAAASETVKRVFLELGGKSAMVVLDDANFAGAAMYAAFMICSHAGQGCALTTRLLVPRGHHDSIVDQVAANIARVTYGDPTDPKTFMGPLISADQRDKVDGMVQRAIAAGATLVTGGTRIDPGFFYTPTVLSHVDPDSEIAQEEVFGPVLSVLTFRTPQEAVAKANNTPYGLSAGVWTDKGSRILWMADQLRAGVVWANTFNKFDPTSPFGGFKESGYGREGGRHGLEGYVTTGDDQ
jgi:acyl-CoA reductase-like NAD-dependent aldehyde dehydrogenase